MPARWPDLADVVTYGDRVRHAIRESIAKIDMTSTDVMAHKARVLSMVIEHELMHQETVLYMVQQLSPAQRMRPRDVSYCFENGIRPGAAPVAEGVATLGASFAQLDFGWDNEFPRTTIFVPAFVIDTTPVTNGQFRYFVESGGYDWPEFWSETDWAWKSRADLTHPSVWAKRNGTCLPGRGLR